MCDFFSLSYYFETVANDYFRNVLNYICFPSQCGGRQSESWNGHSPAAVQGSVRLLFRHRLLHDAGRRELSDGSRRFSQRPLDDL